MRLRAAISLSLAGLMLGAAPAPAQEGEPLVPPAEADTTPRPVLWSLVVRYGEPLGFGAGAALRARFAEGRHLLGADARIYPGDWKLDGSAAYEYRGLRSPIIGVQVMQAWDQVRGGGTVGADTVASALLERIRSASLTTTFVIPRESWLGWVSTGVDVRDRTRLWEDPDARGTDGVTLPEIPLDVGAVLTLGLTTARARPLGIGPDQGFTASTSLQARRYVEPFLGERGYFRLLGRGARFVGFEVGGFAPAVLAAQVTAAADFGSRTPGFGVGGAGAAVGGVAFGPGLDPRGSLDFPVRGYDPAAQHGDRAVTGTAELRFPIARLDRRLPVVPISLDNIWGDFFVDAGGAWCVARCDPLLDGRGEADPLASGGVELGVTLTLVGELTLPLRVGLAIPFVPADSGPADREGAGAPELYLRLGRSF